MIPNKRSLVALLFAISSSLATAAEKDAKDLALGTVTKVEGRSVTLEKKGEVRTIQFPESEWGLFMGFTGIGAERNAPMPGDWIRAAITGGYQVKNAFILPAVPPLEPIPDKHTKTAEELYAIADLDQSGEVDLVEYSTKIFQSGKHLPQHYPRWDADGNDTLNLEEFTHSLGHSDWWRYSRKSSAQWVEESDANGSGEMERDELEALLKGHHTDFDGILADLDADESGGLTANEFQGYLDRKILGIKSPRKKKSKQQGGNSE